MKYLVLIFEMTIWQMPLFADQKLKHYVAEMSWAIVAFVNVYIILYLYVMSIYAIHMLTLHFILTKCDIFINKRKHGIWRLTIYISPHNLD